MIGVGYRWWTDFYLLVLPLQCCRGGFMPGVILQGWSEASMMINGRHSLCTPLLSATHSAMLSVCSPLLSATHSARPYPLALTLLALALCHSLCTPLLSAACMWSSTSSSSHPRTSKSTLSS